MTFIWPCICSNFTLVMDSFIHYVLAWVLKFTADWPRIYSDFSLVMDFSNPIITINSGLVMTLDFIINRFFYLSSFSLMVCFTSNVWSMVHSRFIMGLIFSINWCVVHSCFSLIMSFFIVWSPIHLSISMFLGFRDIIMLTICLNRGTWHRLFLLLIF